MDANVEFYADWFKWLEERTAQLTHNDPLKLLELTSEVAALLKADVALWKSLAATLHGGGFMIPIQVGVWVSKNPDPLKVTRETMRALRAKFGEVAANVQK